MSIEQINTGTIAENSKYISVERIISNYNRNHRQFPLDSFDAVEWIYETLKDIGSEFEYANNAVVLECENSRALLPCDVYKIIAVYEPNCLGCPVWYESDGVYLQFKDVGRTKIGLTFWSIPKDENGAPLILEEYQQACVANLFIRNQAFNDWYTSKIDQNRYDTLVREYHRLCGDARGSFKNVSQNDIEAWTRYSTKMVRHYKDIRSLRL